MQQLIKQLMTTADRGGKMSSYELCEVLLFVEVLSSVHSNVVVMLDIYLKLDLV